MDVYFLGTGAGLPSKLRNVTSIALTLYQERRSFWLFDCGEATQHQMLNSPLKLSKLEKVFITHLHGDHIYGLPGLLTSKSAQGGGLPLTVYGPPGIDEFIRTALSVSRSFLCYDLEVVEYLHDGTVFEDLQFHVETKKLNHTIDSYGFRIEESKSPGMLDPKKAMALGVPEGPLFGQLKRGEPVTLSNGRIVSPEEVLSSPVTGRVVTILGDTRPCAASVVLAKGADLLVHEATFADGDSGLAASYGHSSIHQAIDIAKKAQVKRLVVTHLSNRYTFEEAEQFVASSREAFPETHLATDHAFFSVERKSRAALADEET